MAQTSRKLTTSSIWGRMLLTAERTSWQERDKEQGTSHREVRHLFSRTTKITFHKACVESTLLYGAETWEMNKALQDRLNGTYIIPLLPLQNLSWKNHPTKAQIHGDILPISTVMTRRKTCFTGHCYRAKDQITSDILLWRLLCPSRGSRPLTYPDIVARDAGLTNDGLDAAMSNKTQWRNR